MRTVFGTYCCHESSKEVGAELKISLCKAGHIAIQCVQEAVNEVIPGDIRLKHIHGKFHSNRKLFLSFTSLSQHTSVKT